MTGPPRNDEMKGRQTHSVPAVHGQGRRRRNSSDSANNLRRAVSRGLWQWAVRSDVIHPEQIVQPPGERDVPKDLEL
jgi:hypothetical protein